MTFKTVHPVGQETKMSLKKFNTGGFSKMDEPTNFYCEAWVGKEWTDVSVETALTYPDLVVRCLECKGAIRLHNSGPMNRPKAHAEHRRRFTGCSLGDCFDGTHKRNPEIVKSPTGVSSVPLIPEEIINPKTYKEGALSVVSVNRFERDRTARSECLKHYGYSCTVCDFNFENRYGKNASKIIHVHHLKPLSEIGEEYRINPIDDLRPVCPNCHAVIHSKGDAYSINEVKKMLQK